MILGPIPDGLWDHYAPELRPVRSLVALGSAGGFSGSALWRFDATVGPILLRAWPFGTSPERVGQVHHWLAPLTKFAWVAAPLPDRTGATNWEADGRVWELTKFLSGQADRGCPPTPAHLTAMFESLAHVHRVLGVAPVLGFSPGLAARRDELRQLIAQEFVDLRRVLAASPPGEATELAHAWLNQATPAAPIALLLVEAAGTWIRPLQPVIRDARPDHFLFEGDQLTGLVDFGAMGVDSVAADLARLLGEAIGPHVEPFRAALAAYQAVRLLPAEDRAVVDAFGVANAVLGGARWVRWHFIDQRRFDDPDAVVAGLRRALARLAGLHLWDR